jgi:nucleotide-binding universal stress UspA family protein/sulfur relay (sulfurtransferase) DsrF/TusC family protein
VSRDRGELIIRRILVALDASPHSLAALQAAVALASRFGAELSGLYVEDINLLRLAELPFAQEVGQFSASRRQLDVKGLERQMRAQTLRVRRIFRGTSQRAEIRWSFSVTRGRVDREVLSAATGADVLVLGRAGWSLIRPRQMGSTTRAVLAQAPGWALILQEGACLGQPVVVVYDGSALAQGALDAAAALLEEDLPMTVLLLADEPRSVETLKAQIHAWLGEKNIQVRYRILTRFNVPSLVDALETERCGTVVLPARSAILSDSALQALLDEIQVPVLLVR